MSRFDFNTFFWFFLQNTLSDTFLASIPLPLEATRYAQRLCALCVQLREPGISFFHCCCFLVLAVGRCHCRCLNYRLNFTAHQPGLPRESTLCMMRSRSSPADEGDGDLLRLSRNPFCSASSRIDDITGGFRPVCLRMRRFTEREMNTAPQKRRRNSQRTHKYPLPPLPHTICTQLVSERAKNENEHADAIT